MPKITRLTLFKVPDVGDIEKAIFAFSTLAKDAIKDGKPYILSASANMIYPDPRNQGYNLAAHADFSSKEDMDYYDNADLAHAIIKDVLKGKLDGPPLVIYEKWGDEDTGMSRLEELPN